MLQTSAEFVAGYVPPDYLIDGLLQRRYVYSLTAPTGFGKTAIALLIAAHVAMGMRWPDVRSRRAACCSSPVRTPTTCAHAGSSCARRWVLDPDTRDVVFMPFTPNLSKKEIRERIDAEAAELGPFALLIVDTSASYYSGDDENDNVALGNHARMLRTFVELPGGPTILVTCHPTKTPDMTNLLPRGGGAFLAEVDGNLVCLIEARQVVEVTTHGKFRGPEFTPFTFKLKPGTSAKLVDRKGRSIWTVTASVISDAELKKLEQQGQANQDALLSALLDIPGSSLTELAERLGWRTASDGKPNKITSISGDVRIEEAASWSRCGAMATTS